MEEEVGTVAGAGEEEVGAGREPRRSAWPPVAAGPALPGLLPGAAPLRVSAGGHGTLPPCVAAPPCLARTLAGAHVAS